MSYNSNIKDCKRKFSSNLDISSRKNFTYGDFKDVKQRYGDFKDVKQRYGDFKDVKQRYGDFKDVKQRYGDFKDVKQSYGDFKDVKQSYASGRVYDSVLELIGNTPLVKLNKIPKQYGLSCDIYVKCEFFNPGGSIKDRVAYAMMEHANPVITNETRFVEPTSGNTGIGICLNATLRDKKCTIITQEKNSDEKDNTMRLLGGEVAVLPNSVSETDVARKFKDQNPDTVILLGQFDNEWNPKIHYEQTAVEILNAIDNVDMLAVAAGTGGTFTGLGHKFKEINKDCIIIAAEPDGSTIFNKHKKFHSFLVEGVGGKETPINTDVSLADKIEVVTDKDAFLMARALVKEEGLLCGGSSGLNVMAAIQAAKKLRLGPGKKVVVVLPDSIRNYMSKFVTAQWMEAHLFMPIPVVDMNWYNDEVSSKLYDLLDTVYSTFDEKKTVKEVLDQMEQSESLAVVTTKKIIDNQPVCIFVGIFSKDSLRRRITSPTLLFGDDTPTFNFDKEIVEDHLAKDTISLAYEQFPHDNIKLTIGLISRILDTTPLVVLGNRVSMSTDLMPKYVITGADILNYIYKYQ